MTQSKLAILETIAIPVESKVFSGVDLIVSKDKSGMVLSYQECKFPISADCMELFLTDFVNEIRQVWKLYGEKKTF